MNDPHIALVQEALRGRSVAVREIVELVSPAIQVSVGATLRRRVASSARSRARHEVEDLTQEVLCALFEDRGRRLRAWDPEKGLSLPGYVKLVARHLVLSFLRKRARRTWEDDPVDGDPSGTEPQPSSLSTESPEHLAERREVYEGVLAALEAELSAQGRQILRLLVVERQSVEQIRATTGLTSNAVHIWRSRIAKRATEARRSILNGEPADR